MEQIGDISDQISDLIIEAEMLDTDQHNSYSQKIEDTVFTLHETEEASSRLKEVLGSLLELAENIWLCCPLDYLKVRMLSIGC